MNERIRELVRQAVVAVDIVTGNEALDDELAKMYIPDCFSEKFAELIVKDLIDSMIKRYGDDDELPIQEIKLFVKEHFGVEERKGWVCSKCGVDRIRDVCPKGDSAALTGECPMTGKALLGVKE
jgi:hypothetical protein